ncbi:glycosyltransferase family 4 protein [Parabacteroides sp. FAFU027]|uniref:glycosyltransferase family 4 protein n=1 Tax=Parabacteroides sp. FAFU027 TaxID=2922715 RepID=UPI001FAEA814|nr:glycosyltransferase family 4 protein [Parabacteroides sp. FAFU027]
MKKIALISFEFPPEMATGGIGSYIFHLSSLLSMSGFDVHVFSATSKIENQGVVSREFCTNHLVYATTTDEFSPNVLSVFAKIHDEIGFDLMESPEVGACALKIKQNFPEIPLIVKLHSPGVLITKISRTYQPVKDKLRFVLGGLLRGRIDLGYWALTDKNRRENDEFKICQLADKLISPSMALKKWVVRYWGINSHQIEIVPNPYLLEKKDQDELVNREKVVLFVGKLTVLKGMIGLTNSIPLIIKKNPEYRIKIVGRDEYDPYLGMSVKAYMINALEDCLDKIDFVGVLDRNSVDNLFKTATVSVFPSLWENYPTVVLEAMANGCPVVASDVGGFKEIIEDGKSGLLFNPLKSIDIAHQVNKLISNASLQATFSKNGMGNIRKMQSDLFFNRVLSAYN